MKPVTEAHNFELTQMVCLSKVEGNAVKGNEVLSRGGSDWDDED